MRRLQVYLVAIVVWFSFLFNIERLINPINVASFVYVYTAGLAVLILTFPAFYSLSSFKLFILALIPYFILKVVLGYEIAGSNLPITFTEISAIGVTITLAWNMGKDLSELHDDIVWLAIGQLKKGANDFSEGQSQIYREVRRARRFNRPAVLLTIAPTTESVNLAVNRFIKEAQESIAKKYISARIARMLEGHMKDSDVITKYEDYFVLLLPETSNEQVPTVVRRIKAVAKEELELSLKVGYSSFPDEAVTFSSLLEHAAVKMSSDQPGFDMPGSELLGGELPAGSGDDSQAELLPTDDIVSIGTERG